MTDTLKHEFDSSWTCNYYGITEEKKTSDECPVRKANLVSALRALRLADEQDATRERNPTRALQEIMALANPLTKYGTTELRKFATDVSDICLKALQVHQ